MQRKESKEEEFGMLEHTVLNAQRYAVEREHHIKRCVLVINTSIHFRILILIQQIITFPIPPPRHFPIQNTHPSLSPPANYTHNPPAPAPHTHSPSPQPHNPPRPS